MVEAVLLRTRKEFPHIPTRVYRLRSDRGEGVSLAEGPLPPSIAWSLTMFILTGADSEAALDRLLKRYPIERVAGQGG